MTADPLVLEPLAETADTVTISRAHYERLLEMLEDIDDMQFLSSYSHAQMAEDAAAGVSGDGVVRLMDGEAPVRVFRNERGLSAEQLAAAAGLAVADLLAIEAGGTLEDSARDHLAAALSVTPDMLTPWSQA